MKVQSAKYKVYALYITPPIKHTDTQCKTKVQSTNYKVYAVHITPKTSHTDTQCKSKVQSTKCMQCISLHQLDTLIQSAKPKYFRQCMQCISSFIRPTKHTVADECKIKVQSTIKVHAVHMIRPTKHTDTQCKTNVQSAKYKVHAEHITPTNTHYYINTQYKAKRTKRKATELRGWILAQHY